MTKETVHNVYLTKKVIFFFVLSCVLGSQTWVQGPVPRARHVVEV